jgi:uncharacterized protein (DUF1778 family)
MLAVKKDQKIEIRVSSIELELVNRAAELRSEKRSQFVRQRLLQAATRTIAEAQSLPLRLKDYDRLRAALDEPVRPLPRLKRLFNETSVFGE